MDVPSAFQTPVLSYLEPVRTLLAAKGGEIYSIASDASVHRAVSLMSEKGIGCLVVMDKADKLVGIVSERDYARKVILQGRNSHGTRVREIMTSHVVTIRPDDSIEATMRLMTDGKFRHLPVLDGDAVVGLVSIGDVVNWMLNAQQAAIRELQGQDAPATSA